MIRQVFVKKGKIYENIEKYSILRALSAIDRSNVVLFLIDGEKGIRDQDKHVVGLAHDALVKVLSLSTISGIQLKKMRRPCQRLKRKFVLNSCI